MRSILLVEFIFPLLIAVAWHPLTAPAAVNTLRHFAGGANDGAMPQAAPVQNGSVLFGTTMAGGDSDGGTIYKVNSDGAAFSLLHEFSIATGTGLPTALTLGGPTLYGVSQDDGPGLGGTVFKINTDGSGFDLLHEFQLAGDDGSRPLAPLTQVGSTLYGTTELGGSGGVGTVFKVNIDGTGYQRLHDFAGGTADGARPSTKLAIAGSTLYGTTLSGGTADAGTLFKINVDGSGFQLLHEFADEVGNGETPSGSVLLDGSVLYGTTNFGGSEAGAAGTVYRINTDGSSFDLLHEFNISEGPGFPATSLTMLGSVLYGTTSSGGANNDGTIFKLNNDGSGFATLHEFSTVDGSLPSELVLSGSQLFGTTSMGGSFGFGTLFSLPIGGFGAASGDYNGDGAVNAADFSAWKGAFGSSSNLAADGSANSIVDAADYTVWRDHMGAGSAAGGMGAAVPEPATICAAVLMLAVAAMHRSIR